MAELIPTNSICKLYHIREDAVMRVLKGAGVEPVHVTPLGRGVMRLYDPGLVKKAFDEWLKSKEPKAVEPAPASASDDPSPILGAINAMANEAAEEHAALVVLCKRLADQNVLLLRSVEDMRANVYAKIDGLQAAIDAMAHPLDQPAAPAEPVVATQPRAEVIRLVEQPKPAKPKVCIVGLLGDQKRMIEKEFGPVFDLRIYESGGHTNYGGREFIDAISRVDHIVVMTSFIGHSAENAIRAVKAKPVRVTGGMTNLRDRLTEIFVNQPGAVQDQKTANN